MMRCRDVHHMASAYLDGELDDTRASALRGHLRVCPDCLAAVRDLATVRDTMAGLDPVEPPPALWAAIERGLAEAEIADARRSRVWLRWQQVRPRLLPAAVTLAAVAAAVLWLVQRPASTPERTAAPVLGRAAAGGERPATRATATPAPGTLALAGAGQGDGPEEGFFARRERERTQADQRYRSTLVELRELVAAERDRWPAEASARFDSRMAAFQAEARRHRETLDDEAADMGARDDLYAVYQAEIAFLQSAAIYGAAAIEGGDVPGEAGGEGAP